MSRHGAAHPAVRVRAAPPADGRPGGRDALLLAVAITAVSTSGPLMAATAVPALAIAFWRNALAGVVLWPVALLRRRAELRSLEARELRLALLAGVLLALHFGTWVPSLTFTSVASATALVCTQPVWAALLSGLRGVAVGRRVWAGIGLATAGAVLLTGVDLQTGTRALVGDGLALLGGLFAAGYVVVGGEVRRSVSTTTYTTLCYSTAAALLLVACLVGRQSLAGYAAVDWLRLAGITLGAQMLGHSLFNVVLRRVSPTVVSLLVLLEIPGAALIALVFLGQVPPLLALPAALLLLAGLAVVVGAGSGRAEPAVPVE
jgi:drug/metabolite transporter (DMT)-like permease